MNVKLHRTFVEKGRQAVRETLFVAVPENARLNISKVTAR